MKKLMLSVLITVLTGCSIFAQFISDVIEYVPAPGQYINSTPWADSNSAQTLIGVTNGTVSLGAFGGYIVFTFDSPVQNHPDNPFGVDFTIFGNSNGLASEPAVVYVMQDENNNGLPDDQWYLLAPSDYFFSSTVKNYEVTYFNPDSEIAEDVNWTDNYSNSGVVEANIYHQQAYYPFSDIFPNIPQDSYTLQGVKISGHIDRSIPSFVKSKQRKFGFADNIIRGAEPFVIPDNPYTAEVENSGGDAFDISWAVNAEGYYVELDEIDFVKVQTAMMDNLGWLGEISAEITGAVDVEPNTNINGIEDCIVVKELSDTLVIGEYQLEVFTFTNGRLNNDREIAWNVVKGNAFVDEQDVLHIISEGEVSITCEIVDAMAESATINTFAVNSSASFNFSVKEDIKIYPNPVRSVLAVSVESADLVEILDCHGRVVKVINNYSSGESIDVGNLPAGLYFARITNLGFQQMVRLVKI